MTDSQTLLSLYARTGSEPAFRDLVARYLDLVYSTACRLVDGDAESAKDVAQTVFVALAAKARTLPPDVMLGGWLHQHTRFVAGQFMRTERRRRSRERQAAEMHSMEDHSRSPWAQIAPVLDEAIDELDETDRNAILLRFFERKDFRSLGKAIGSSEDAARKRVDRALEKLHVLLKQRGATLSIAALASCLSTEAVTVAPAGLAATVSTVALAHCAADASLTSTLVNTLSSFPAKAALCATIGLGILSLTLYRSQMALLEENRSLRQQVGQLEQSAVEFQRLLDLRRNTKPGEPDQVAAPPGRADSSSAKAKRDLEVLRSENARLHAELAGPTNGVMFAYYDRSGQANLAIVSGSNVPPLAFLSATTNAFARSARQALTEAAEQRAMERATSLKERLSLTPEQFTNVQGVILAQVEQSLSGRTTSVSLEELVALESGSLKRVDQVRALLNPEQQAAYDALKSEERIAQARAQAASEVVRLQQVAGLTPEQQDTAFAVLYQELFKQLSTGAPIAWLPRLQRNLEALGAVLSPSQLEAYRLSEEQANKPKPQYAAPAGN